MQNMMKDGESMLKIQPLLWFCSFVSFFLGNRSNCLAMYFVWPTGRVSVGGCVLTEKYDVGH